MPQFIKLTVSLSVSVLIFIVSVPPASAGTAGDILTTLRQHVSNYENRIVDAMAHDVQTEHEKHNRLQAEVDQLLKKSPAADQSSADFGNSAAGKAIGLINVLGGKGFSSNLDDTQLEGRQINPALSAEEMDQIAERVKPLLTELQATTRWDITTPDNGELTGNRRIKGRFLAQRLLKAQRIARKNALKLAEDELFFLDAYQSLRAAIADFQQTLAALEKEQAAAPLACKESNREKMQQLVKDKIGRINIIMDELIKKTRDQVNALGNELAIQGDGVAPLNSRTPIWSKEMIRKHHENLEQHYGRLKRFTRDRVIADQIEKNLIRTFSCVNAELKAGAGIVQAGRNPAENGREDGGGEGKDEFGLRQTREALTEVFRGLSAQ